MSKKYQIIYADPPWKYDFSKDNSDKIENHYPTMSYDELTRLEVPSEDNAALYLWATAPKLIEALGVMKAWGFEYKTHCIWDKDWIGMGYWFRGQHELLLVGVKGKFSPPKSEFRVSSVYRERRQNHSRKPDFFRELIKRTYPEMKKLEMFARRENALIDKFEGWDVWGNEVKSNIDLTPLIEIDEKITQTKIKRRMC